jgi:hypothetical protein
MAGRAPCTFDVQLAQAAEGHFQPLACVSAPRAHFAGQDGERKRKETGERNQMSVSTAETGNLSNLSNLSAGLRIRAAAERHCIRIEFSMTADLRHCTPIAFSMAGTPDARQRRRPA